MGTILEKQTRLFQDLARRLPEEPKPVWWIIRTIGGNFFIGMDHTGRAESSTDIKDAATFQTEPDALQIAQNLGPAVWKVHRVENGELQPLSIEEQIAQGTHWVIENNAGASAKS